MSYLLYLITDFAHSLAQASRVVPLSWATTLMALNLMLLILRTSGPPVTFFGVWSSQMALMSVVVGQVPPLVFVVLGGYTLCRLTLQALAPRVRRYYLRQLIAGLIRRHPLQGYAYAGGAV